MNEDTLFESKDIANQRTISQEFSIEGALLDTGKQYRFEFYQPEDLTLSDIPLLLAEYKQLIQENRRLRGSGSE